MSFIIRLVLTALLFAFVLPMIPGVTVTSGLLAIVLLAFVYRIASIFMTLVCFFISAFATALTGGLALLILIPASMLAFWILPTLTLSALSHLMPQSLSFTGWVATGLSGLAMFFLHLLTDARKSKENKS